MINAVHLTFQALFALQVQPHQEKIKDEENGAEGVHSQKRPGQQKTVAGQSGEVLLEAVGDWCHY